MDRPLLPQLSFLGTPRLRPSIKVLDMYNVLPPPHCQWQPYSPRISCPMGFKMIELRVFLSVTGIRD